MSDAGQRTRAVVPAALSASVLAPLNSTMIVVALPTMLADLGASLTWGSWVVVSYLVAMAAVQPLGGSLGDRFGRPRMMRLGLVGFTLSTILAALAPNVTVLVVARTLQAVTGASAIPNGTALVRAWLPADRQGRALGAIGAGVGLAAALGPPLGGVVTEFLGWRWIFATNLLVLVPGLIWAWQLPERAPSDEAPPRFDGGGAALVLATLVGAALAGTIWRVPGVPVYVAPVAAIVALSAGIVLRRHLARVPAPVLDLTLFGRPGFLAAGLSVMLSNLTMYTVFLAVPIFLAQLAGWGAGSVGLALAGMSVLMMILGPIGGAWSDRIGRRRPAVVGKLVAAIGVAAFIAIEPSWSWVWMLLPLMVIGTGIGMGSAPVQVAALQVAGRHKAGQAAGLFSTMRYVGSITGTAAMAALLGPSPGPGVFRFLFGGLVVSALLAALASTRLPATPTSDD